MQAREAAIQTETSRRDPSAGNVITANTVSTFFTPLAEHALDRETGVLAKVLPVTACTSASGIAERRFLAERFHIERIVTSHDPKRPNFSENTGIHEALLIARRKNSGSDRPTEFVALARMPGESAEPRAAIEDLKHAIMDEDPEARQPPTAAAAGDPAALATPAQTRTEADRAATGRGRIHERAEPARVQPRQRGVSGRHAAVPDGEDTRRGEATLRAHGRTSASRHDP